MVSHCFDWHCPTPHINSSQLKCESHCLNVNFSREEFPEHPTWCSELPCIPLFSQPFMFTLSLEYKALLSKSLDLLPAPRTQHRSDTCGTWWWRYNTATNTLGINIYIFTWILKIQLRNPVMPSLVVPQTRPPHRVIHVHSSILGNNVSEVLDLPITLVTF